jgi:hypothetical protein
MQDWTLMACAMLTSAGNSVSVAAARTVSGEMLSGSDEPEHPASVADEITHAITRSPSCTDLCFDTVMRERQALR